MDFRIPVGNWINDGLEWIEINLEVFFEGMRSTFKGMYDGMDWLFSSPPTLAIIAVLAIAALFARGWKFAIGVTVGLLFIVSVGQWDNAVDTLALVIVAAFIAIALSIPLGIWAARNDTVSAILKPVMDFLQTMPAFVYLMPALALLRVGVAPGIFATILFAMAPGVRLTELGIRGVDKEVVEAGQAFGASPRRILRQIQLPLAMPSIMAGINQIIMLSLSMVVIAGLVGAGGLGGDVVRSLSSLDYPLGFEAGLAVVVLAIILDRFTGSFGQGLGMYAWLRNRHSAKKTEDELARLESQQIQDTGPRRNPGS
ncbi:ABC transporter permease [Demequina aestuarii]|uniref:ABC transporter permease n=1 Tax=Demequina aestuarii TaxID=327095 RepID=UPI00078138A9|nr:ABC transporter permease subunit [Demequina aestuarii]